MCKKLRMARDIDNLSISSVLTYVKKLVRLYCILFVILLIILLSSATSGHESHTSLATGIVALVLYIACAAALYLVTTDASARNALLPVFLASTISLFNFVDMIYTVAVTKNYYGLFSLISLALQIPTIYILYKLYEKLSLQPGKRYDPDGSVNDQRGVRTPTATPVGGDVESAICSPMGKVVN